jgi:peptidoglycan/LPS O-acetylase OafA/YrhL
MVFVSHLGVVGYLPELKGLGRLGVVLFFVLSGFLMSLLYTDQTSSARAWLRYAIRRVFRVYPMYAVTVIGSYLIFEVLDQKWALPVKRFMLFDHLRLSWATHHLWTIPVEIKFYACFPFIAWLVTRASSPRLRAVLITALLAGFMIFAPRDEPFAVWGYIDIFVFGILAAQLHLNARTAPSRTDAVRAPSSAWSAALVASFLALLLLVPWVSERIAGVRFAAFRDTYATATPCFVLIFAATRCGGWVRSLLVSRPARFLGAISYSLYLTHAHVLRFVLSHVELPAPVEIALSTLLALLLAWLCYRLVETPFRALGRRLSVRVATTGP